MGEPRAPAQSVPGPRRWAYRLYEVAERPTPFGRRFESYTSEEELVFVVRARKADSVVAFLTEEDDGEVLFTLEPDKRVRQFQKCLKLVDGATKNSFGQIRKKVYEPSGKSEWFLFNRDAEEVGLVTETAADPSLLRRLVPVDRIFPKAWAVHWRQTVAGKIQPKPTLLGDRHMVDLRMDKKDEIDRRIVLATLVALRLDLHAKDEKRVRGGDGDS